MAETKMEGLEGKLKNEGIGYGDCIYLGKGTKEVPKEVVGFVHWHTDYGIGLTDSWPCYSHNHPQQYYLKYFNEFRVIKKAKE